MDVAVFFFDLLVSWNSVMLPACFLSLFSAFVFFSFYIFLLFLDLFFIPLCWFFIYECKKCKGRKEGGKYEG